MNLAVREGDNSEANARKMYEDKLKRLEEDKLAMLSGKNTEIHRLSEEGKTLAEVIKKKESDLRRVGN